MNDEVLSPETVERLRQADLTYPEVGRTAGPLPAGYFHMDREGLVGVGEETFKRAAEELLSWQLQRRAGIRVRASTPEVTLGAVAVLLLGVGPLAIQAPVRVLSVIDEPTRRGFVYGTLPGHPESGEEQFLVELLHDGRVVCRITAFSRPGSWLTRLGGPAARLVQRWVTTRYLNSLRERP